MFFIFVLICCFLLFLFVIFHVLILYISFFYFPISIYDFCKCLYPFPYSRLTFFTVSSLLLSISLFSNSRFYYFSICRFYIFSSAIRFFAYHMLYTLSISRFLNFPVFYHLIPMFPFTIFTDSNFYFSRFLPNSGLAFVPLCRPGGVRVARFN